MEIRDLSHRFVRASDTHTGFHDRIMARLNDRDEKRYTALLSGFMTRDCKACVTNFQVNPVFHCVNFLR